MNYRGSRLSDKLFLFYIRNIPNHPFKIRIVNWINEVLFNSATRLTNTNGATYQLSTREYIGHHIIYVDGYEALTLKKCTEILSAEGGSFLDIGANIGLYSIHLSKLANVAVYSIEPYPQNFMSLLKNIELNKQKNIFPVNIGLTNTDSFAYIVNDLPLNSGTAKVELNGGGCSTLIRLTTLSQLVAYLGLSEIKLIKIDVEGFEMNVIKGFFTNTTVYPDNIILEFSDYIERTGYNMADTLNYVKDQGYEAFTITGEPYLLNDDLPEHNIWFKLSGSKI